MGSRTPLTRVLTIVYAGAVVVVSLWFLVTGTAEALEAHGLREDVAHFIRIPCDRLDTDAITHSSKHGNSYAPELRCRYQVDARSYEVDTRFAGLGGGFATRDDAIAEAELQRSRMDHALVDPDALDRAVLSRQVVCDQAVWAKIFGGAFIPVVVLIALGLQAGKKVRARRVARAAAAEPIPTARIVE